MEVGSVSHRLPLADIRFIADFAAFCRGKGDWEYCATDPFECALARYGFRDVHSFNARELGVPVEAFHQAIFEPHTFSALADRLEALIADAPMVSA